MASFFDLFFGKKKEAPKLPVLTPVSKTGSASTNTNPYLQPQSATQRGADAALSQLGKAITPQLSPSGQRRHEQEQKVIKSSPFYRNAGPLIDEAVNAVGGFMDAQVELAKPVKRNQGESNLDYAARSTGTKFLPGIASQGYKAAEVVVPALRASTFTPQVIGKVSNAFLPEAVSSRLTPAFQAYSVLRSPDKWAALGNIGIDYGTDFASKLFTGKTLFENIDQSTLPDWGKGLARTGYNMVSGLAGAKAGTRVGKYVGDVGKAVKAAAPGIAEGRKVYNETGSFDKALDAITDKNLELQRSLQGKVGESDVKGFTNIPKPINASEVQLVPKTVDQEFRGDKLNLPPEQLKQIEDRLSGLGLTTRSVRSFDEVKSLAEELGTDPRKLLANNGKLTDAKVVALKNLINQNSEFIAKNSGLKFKTEQENAIHQQKLRAADAQQNEALAQLIGGGTELGRGIAAFRILANKSMEPAFWYKKGQQTRGNALTPEQKANIDGLIKENDRVGLSMYVASLRDPSLSEKFSTLWKAGLLTNVTTHVANVAGNASMAALRGVSNLVGTGIDKLISLGTGKRTMTVSPGAALKGFGQGAKKGLNILRTGVNPDDLEGKFDIKGSVNFGNSVLGRVANGYTKTVFGALQAEDALFRGMHESESLANQAKLTAINEGLKGPAKQARIAELLENPTDAMKQTALQEARVATFNNDNIVASKVGQLKSGRNKDDSWGSKALATIVDVTMPFVKTPTNVVARIAEYTPLGLLKLAAGQLNKNTRGQKRLVEDLSKVVTGGAVLALGSALANQGFLTGSMPASASERAQWEAEGKQPNSIYVNGRWYQINKLAPIGFLFALAADNATSGSVAETGLKGLKNLTDQTFLTGLSGGLKAVTDPKQNAASYVKQTASSVIPSGLGAIARVIDPTMRTTGGVGEAIQAKIPGLTSSLAPRLDIFGQEMKVEGGVLGLLDPTRSKADKSNDPVLRETKKLGVTIGMPSNRMFNTTLDTYEYAEFQKVNGRVLKDVLDTLVVSPLFQNASTAKKEELLEKTVTKVRAQTKAAVFPKILQKRLELPQVENPEILNEIANKLYKNETFNAMSKEQQRQFVLDIVQQL